MTAVSDAVRAKKGIIFDLFHTLTALELTWGGGLPTTCELLGADRKAWDDQLHLYSRRRLTGELRDPFEIVAAMARALDPSIPDARITEAVANRIRRFEAALVDMPAETTRVIRCLKEAGKTIALISNADVMEVQAWGRCPAAGLFDTAVFSCAVGCAKPEPRIYHICLERLGLKASDCVFVGDGGADELRGAREVGLTTVMITGIIAELWPDRIEARKQHADYVIEHLSELVNGWRTSSGG